MRNLRHTWNDNKTYIKHMPIIKILNELQLTFGLESL